MKRCRNCDIDKPLDEFHRCKTRPDGVTAYCKPCGRAKARDWRARNVEVVRRRDQERYRTNPDRKESARNSSKAFRAANPEKARASSRAASRRWAERNRSLYLARKRLEMKKRRFSGETVEYAAVLDGDPCSYCGGFANTLDHIVPLKHGGSNEWDNLTASCRSCNSRKNANSLLHHLVAA